MRHTAPDTQLRRPSTHLGRVGRLSLVAAAVVAATGCSTAFRIDQVQDANTQTVADADARTQAMRTSVESFRNTGMVDSDVVARPFIVGEPVALAPEVTLPAALRQGVNTTLLFRGGARDLMALAEGITRATGIPVRVKPDAMLPMANFLPRAGGSAAASAPGGSSLESSTIDIRSEEAPLNTVLDRVSSRLALSWRYDGRAIEFFRLESRTFNIKALPITTATTAGLGRNSSQGGAFENASATRFATAETDPMVAVRASIEARMTRAGLGPVISPETGTIVVTDTPEALDAIGAYLDRENRLFSRRVELVFEAISVRVRDNAQAGFDWTVLERRIMNEVTGAALNLGLRSPSSLVGTAAGSLAATADGSRYNGSQAVISALSEIGSVVSVTRVPLQGVNRRPLSYAVRTTFNYIDQATGSSAASAVGTTTAGPSITQKDETVGTILTLVPDVDDDGVVTMSVSYDNTVLTRLEPITTGTGAASVTVQQKEIDGAGMLQQITTRSGVPTLIGGFERQSRDATIRRLDRNAPLILGGSNRAVEDRLITVLMVTAVARDGL